MSLPSYDQLDKLADREDVMLFLKQSLKQGRAFISALYNIFTDVTVEVRVSV